MFNQTLTARQQTDRLRSDLGAELPVDLTYAYTARSQIASINDQTVANIDQTFTYDGIGRLMASTGPWGNGTFQYDGLGNLRQRQVGTRTIALSYDANNRLSSHTDTAGSARSLTYDARGNVTALGALGFAYDVSDQPRTVTGTATGSYTYDGHMRRVKQIVGGVTRYSVYDAGGGLVEIDEVGGAKTDYIRASGMTLARIAGSTVTWLHHDHLGSAVAGTNSAGTVVWRESEQPFGEDWTSAAANDNQAGYTGHVEDAATGLTYMQARYYDPVIGRFLSIDPVGFTSSAPAMFNRYAYAANDPVNMWDPDGRKCEKTKEGDQKCSTVVKEGQSEAATKRAEKAQAKIDKAYTKTVNELLKKPEKEVTITVGEASFKTTAGEIAQTLIETDVELDGATPEEKGGNYSRAVTQGGVLSGVGLTPRITINQTAWTQNTFGSTRSADVFNGLMNTLTHEPMHLLPAEKALIPEINKLGGPAFNQAHQLEYYKKAEELLGR